MDEFFKIHYFGAGLKLAQKKRIAVLSNTISRYRAFQNTSRDLFRESGKYGDWIVFKANYTNFQGYRESYSCHIWNMDVRILPISKRGNAPTTTASRARSTSKLITHILRTHRKHFEENHRAKYKETLRGNVDYRIEDTPHSAVQKADANCRQS